MSHVGPQPSQHQTEIESLFNPKPLTEEEKAEDQQAQSLVANAIKVMEALAFCPKTREELNNELNLGMNGMARSLHYVCKRVAPAYVDKTTIKDTVTGKEIDTKYFLTDTGRKVLPPSFFQGQTKTKTRGQKHIHGMVGKVARNPDGSLNLKGLQGKVYDYVKTHPYSTSKDVMKGTGLPEKGTWDLLGRLVKFKLIEFTQAKNSKNHTARQYFIPGFHEGQSPEEKEAQMMRELKSSLTKAATQPEAVPVEESKVTLQPIGASKQPNNTDKVAKAINELLSQGYTPTDIILTVLTTVEAELANLQKLKSTMGDFLKTID